MIEIIHVKLGFNVIEEAIKQNQTEKILINKFMVPESARDESLKPVF
jgi:hypothetical protein